MAEKANKDIRETAEKSKVYLWEIADRLGHSPEWFSRKLRKELPEELKVTIIGIIGELSQGR